MEKLIELLNESALIDLIFEDEIQVRNRKLLIISKELGFIKWLVEKDKIDLGKLIMIKDEEQRTIVDIDNSRENTLIMLLAISDTPIDDLIKYLK